MAIRNQGWYDLNESRPFPVDDMATCLSDEGNRLPNGLIADVQLRFPVVAGLRAWLGAVTSTDKLIAVTILAADSATAAGNFIPLAAVSLPKPVVARRSYPLESLYPGAGGWIVFGEEVSELNWQGKFSLPQQSLLQPSTCWPYETLPIQDFGVLGGEALTGIVKLNGGGDMQITSECWAIPGFPPNSDDTCGPTERRVIVFRLRKSSTVEDNAVGESDPDYNVLAKYVGKCGQRPESDNCGDPQPIESISGVTPDCCGNITLNFTGCASLSEITEAALVNEFGDVVETEATCGFVLDCGLGLTDACVTKDRLPTSDGRLPNEYEDYCESVTLISITLPAEVVENPGTSAVVEESASAYADGGLPYITTFPPGDLSSWTEREGDFITDGYGYFGSISDNSVAARNILTYNGVHSVFYKQITVDVSILSGDPGLPWTIRSPASILHNAGAIMDWRPVPDEPQLYQYWVAEVDWDGHYLGAQSLRISFFDGRNYRTLLSTLVPGIPWLDFPMRIKFSAWPNLLLPGRAWLEASFGTQAGDVFGTVGPVVVADFGTVAGGLAGIHANRSATVWHYFKLDNLYTA